MKHGHQLWCGLQFIYAPADGSTAQSWAVGHVYTFHTQSLAHTLSQVATKMPAGVSTTLSSVALHPFLHEKGTDSEIAR